jgi:hypothetical protein
MKALVLACLLVLLPAPLLATVDPPAILKAEVLDIAEGQCQRGETFLRGVVQIDETYFSIWFNPANSLAIMVEHRPDGTPVEAVYGVLTITAKEPPVFQEVLRLRGPEIKSRFGTPCDWLAGKQA